MKFRCPPPKITLSSNDKQFFERFVPRTSSPFDQYTVASLI